jgi:hypothetical protein
MARGLVSGIRVVATYRGRARWTSGDVRPVQAYTGTAAARRARLGLCRGQAARGAGAKLCGLSRATITAISLAEFGAAAGRVGWLALAVPAASGDTRRRRLMEGPSTRLGGKERALPFYCCGAMPLPGSTLAGPSLGQSG